MPCHCVQNVDTYQYTMLARNFVKTGRRSPGAQRANPILSVHPLEKAKAFMIFVSAQKGMGNEVYD